MDRLALLPEDILIRIISALPLKFAVRTCVLSRRWRCLWTKINLIKLPFPESRIAVRNQVIHKLTSPWIRKFVVQCGKGDTDFRQVEWFSQICARNVEEIEITAPCTRIKVQLPNCLFQIATLVKLELGSGDYVVDLPDYGDSINLPRLENLTIQSLNITDCDLFEKLIKSCSSLEDLSLHFKSCNLSHPTQSVFRICGMNLRRLSIGLELCGKIVIDTPKFEYLEVYTSVSATYGTFSVESNAMALLAADIYLRNWSKTGLMSGIYVAVSRVTSFEIIRPQIVEPATTIGYPYLTRLKLLKIGYLSATQVLQVLHRCPVLESLIVTVIDINNISGINPEPNVPECLKTRIKKIEIGAKFIDRGGSELIAFLLSNARVLELMIVTRIDSVALLNETYEEEFEFCKEVYAFQRGSSRCQIVFFGKHLRVPREGAILQDHVGGTIFLH